ncbi:MAG: flagellar motor switch protein FliN [Chloroflexi bacterium]|nr:flagellar motor switch protein FliN [Chloroflexota bacterium]
MTENSMQAPGSNPVVDAVTVRPQPANGKGLANIDMLMDIPLVVTVELGRTEMTLRQALDLQPGVVIELERLAGDPIDVFINERLIAHGEVVVVDDKFAVRIVDVVSSKDAAENHGEK